jgi:hypothetical protein
MNSPRLADLVRDASLHSIVRREAVSTEDSNVLIPVTPNNNSAYKKNFKIEPTEDEFRIAVRLGSPALRENGLK